MKIAVLGAGAMGRLFAAVLSRSHDVLLLDRNPEKVSMLERSGIRLIEQDGTEYRACPRVAVMGTQQEPVDLVLVFVKSMGTRESLEKCKSLIGEDTQLLTLQNGGGHDKILCEFAKPEHVLIGTTQHNASIRDDGCVFHGGKGFSVIGTLHGDMSGAERVAEAFRQVGFETEASDDVKRSIWRKLMTNCSLSALTAVFGIQQGFIAESESAWMLCERLVREACAVAEADGVHFDVEEKVAEVRAVSVNGPFGVTSICADIRAGRKTEVDTISGSVVAAAKRLGVSAPSHEMMVLMIHAMEDRKESRYQF